MGPAIKERMASWIERWGFAALVSLAASVSVLVGATVAMPHEVPGFALQAAPIYRLETGAATFVGLYLLAMALVLALHNRGFTEIGTRGVKAQDLGGAENRLLQEQAATIEWMEKSFGEMRKKEAD